MGNSYEQWDKLAENSIQKYIEAGGTWAAILSLEPRDREIVALDKLEQELYNGGFVQFFANWGYDVYLVAVDVLEKIGARLAKALVQSCYEVIRHLQDDDTVEELWDIPKYLTSLEHDMLRGLEQAYWKDEDHVCEKACRYFSETL